MSYRRKDIQKKHTHSSNELSEGLYLHRDKKSKSLQPVINLLLNGSSSSGFYNKRGKKVIKWSCNCEYMHRNVKVDVLTRPKLKDLTLALLF